ncbi:hypothetical protein BDZ97DRAFT_1826933 [Flammula alnicola]|nr:hypothetical protein BDZ97DRAFT_1826933 [Flammula alnicola]
MSIVGIAVSPDAENQNKYSISATLVSSVDGSVIGTKSSSEASTTSTLAATLRSLLAEFTDAEPKYYLSSLSSALSPDRFHDVLEALTGFIGYFPITYGQAYYSTLPEAENTSLIDGQLIPSIVHETHIALAEEDGLEDALKKALSYGISQGPITRILLDYSRRLGSLTERAETTISQLFPNAPMVTSNPGIISHAAATFLYIMRSHPPLFTNRAQYVVPIPVSIAMSNGTAVALVPDGYRIPTDQYITLTTSVENQTSATIQLLLGNHPLAKDNLERETVVLNGLTPLPKEAADITVEQEGGPSKGFMFPRFFSGLTDDDEAEYLLASGKTMRRRRL